MRLIFYLQLHMEYFETAAPPQCRNGQTRHVKDSGHSITWKCPQHGTGITEIIMPPAPVYVRRNRPSAVGKYCYVCKNPIHTRYADLAFHCVNPSCDNVCHLAATCSRFINPRRTARARALAPEFGTVISTLHHQQLRIHHYHLTTRLLVQLRHH